MRQRILNKLMDDGVTIMDPASTFIEKGSEIGQDTVIYPYTSGWKGLRRSVKIARLVLMFG